MCAHTHVCMCMGVMVLFLQRPNIRMGETWDWGLEKKSDFGDMVAGWIPVEKMSVCDPQGDGRAHGLYHVGKFD